MPEHRYSRKLFVQEWNVKPRRGRQRKYWCKVVDNLFSSLGLDKAEWLEDIRKGSCSLKSFLGAAGEGIDERESSKFEEGLNSKVKLSLYRTFGKIVEFKKYLRGVGDAGTSGLLGLIKDFVLSVWEERKVRLYGEHANVHQSHSQNDSGDLRGVAGGNGELGCLCGKAGTSHLCDGSAHSSGCVVNGSNAMAAV